MGTSCGGVSYGRGGPRHRYAKLRSSFCRGPPRPLCLARTFPTWLVGELVVCFLLVESVVIGESESPPPRGSRPAGGIPSLTLPSARWLGAGLAAESWLVAAPVSA